MGRLKRGVVACADIMVLLFGRVVGSGGAGLD